MLDSDTEPDHLRCYAGLALLFGGHLPVCCRGWMTRKRFRIAQVDQPLDQLQRVVEFGRGLVSASNSEGHQRAGAASKVFSGKLVIAVILEPDVVDPLDPIVVAQEFSHAAPIFNMTIDSQRDGLDSLEQQKSAERRQD